MSIIHSTEIINGEIISILIENKEKPPGISEYNGESFERTRSTRSGSNIIHDTLQHAQGAFSSGVDLVRHCATQVVAGVQSLDESMKPEELEVQLAIKLGTEAGAVLVNFSGEAQMQVTLKWRLKNV